MSASFDQITGASGSAEEMMPGLEEEVTSIVTTRVYSNKPDFTLDEIAFPRLRLAQGTTPEVQAQEARAGQWVLTGETPENSVVVVPLAFTRRRELRIGEDRQKACESIDAIHGLPSGEYGVGSEKHPSGECETCPMAQWAANPANPNKNLPPPCTFIYSYIVYSVTHKQVVTLELSKTGLTAAKFLNTYIRSREFGNCAVRLESLQQKSGTRVYYIPSIKASSVPEEVKLEAKESFVLPA